MSEKIELKEKDKPFILALISALLVVLCIVGGFLGYPFAENAFTAVMTLISMAWTFYFVKKSEK